jgi:DNA-binding Lrp family transcriptional regulator
MTRAAACSNMSVISEWLQAGNTGTNRQIAAATGVKWDSARTSLQRLERDGYIRVVRTIPGYNNLKTHVYGAVPGKVWVHVVREPVEKPEPKWRAPAGFVATALNRRLPIERAWAASRQQMEHA